MTITIARYAGKGLVPHLPVLARLCTAVFREWPNLYEGDGRYDADHLRSIADSPASLLLIASDGAEPIGASTCLPLRDATPDVQAPFHARGWSPGNFFYLAESVILPRYRGRGMGGQFFAMREAHARLVSDCAFTCFCAIMRPPDHPARPADATSLDAFWRRQGYSPVPGLQCSMAWREIGATDESDLTLQFWIKMLTHKPLPTL
jgi:GNAT superfamily N-acetyltransferase